MKKFILILVFCVCVSASADAQGIIIIKYITSKIIRAIDLKVQQLQNEAINLTVLQKQLENKLTQGSLSQIASWDQKQKDLYAGYFDELTKVKTAIAFTSRISEIMQKEKQVVSDTRKAIQSIYADNHFTAAEVKQFVSGCDLILNQSATNLSLMLEMVSAGKFMMSDGERLTRLMQITDEEEEQETKLNGWLQKIRNLSISREHSAVEIQNIKRLYGFR